jgi:prepilin-type N-terminal cleavage/methylation domain-containing protein
MKRRFLPLASHFRSKSGFTLLELLVVISIIGILMAMGAAAFSTAQQRGRDAKRRADMKAMQSAFEQYYAQNTAYAACATMATTQYLQGGLPTDPQPSKSYTCAYTAATDDYCACAVLEDTGSGNSGIACDFAASTKNYFCVQNLQ